MIIGTRAKSENPPELVGEEGLLGIRVLPVKLVTKVTGATRLVTRLVIGLSMVVKLDMKKRFAKDGTSLLAAPTNIVFQDLYWVFISPNLAPFASFKKCFFVFGKSLLRHPAHSWPPH